MPRRLLSALPLFLCLVVAAYAAGCGNGNPRDAINDVTFRLFYKTGHAYDACTQGQWNRRHKNSCQGGRYVVDDMLLEGAANAGPSSAVVIETKDGKKTISVMLRPLAEYLPEIRERCSHWNEPTACVSGAKLLLEDLAKKFCDGGVRLDQMPDRAGPVRCEIGL